MIIKGLFFTPVTASARGELADIFTYSSSVPEAEGPLTLRQIRALRMIVAERALLVPWRDVILRDIGANGEHFLGNVNETVSAYFAATGPNPILGRLLTASDDASESQAAAPVAVLDYRCWQKHFLADPGVIGRTFTVDGVALSIVGVLSSEFHGLNVVSSPDAYVPLGFDTGPASPASRLDGSQYFLAALLAPHTDASSLRPLLVSQWPSVLDATSDRPHRSGQVTALIGVRPLKYQVAAGSDLQSSLTTPLRRLAALIFLVVAAAGVNLVGFAVNRWLARRDEVALRLALGSHQLRTALVLSVEPGLVCAVSCCLGVTLAYWFGPALLALLVGFEPLKAYSFSVMPGLLAVLAACVSLAIAFLFLVVAPLLFFISRSSARPGAARSQTDTSKTQWARLTLSSAQIALALLFTTSSAYLLRNLSFLTSERTGFDYSRVYQAHLFARQPRLTPDDRSAYFRQLDDHLRRLPGVSSVSFAQPGPFSGIGASRHLESPDYGTSAQGAVTSVSPDFFETLSLPLVSGRSFDWVDTPQKEPVAIVTANLADKLFPAGQALGRTIRVPNSAYDAPTRIVGIVGNVTLWRSSEQTPTLFLAWLQTSSYDNPVVEVRSSRNDIAAFERELETAIAQAGHHVSFLIRPLASERAYLTRSERALAYLASFVGILSLLLAMFGVYTTFSDMVTRQRREIAIRISLGANNAAIFRRVGAAAAWVIAAGLAAGTVLSIIAIGAVRAWTTERIGFGFSGYAICLVVIGASAALAIVPPVRSYLRQTPADLLRG